MIAQCMIACKSYESRDVVWSFRQMQGCRCTHEVLKAKAEAGPATGMAPLAERRVRSHVTEAQRKTWHRAAPGVEVEGDRLAEHRGDHADVAPVQLPQLNVLRAVDAPHLQVCDSAVIWKEHTSACMLS